MDVPGLGMSGLVHLSSIEDDFYVFDAARGHLMGRRTRRVIKLGDQITVQVYKVDAFKKQVDFQLVRPASVPSVPVHQVHRVHRVHRVHANAPATSSRGQSKGPSWKTPF